MKLTVLKNSKENGLNFPAVNLNDTFARIMIIVKDSAFFGGKSYHSQSKVDCATAVLYTKKVSIIRESKRKNNKRWKIRTIML